MGEDRHLFSPSVSRVNQSTLQILVMRFISMKREEKEKKKLVHD